MTIYVTITWIFGVVGIDLTASLGNSPQHNIGLHKSLFLILLTLIIFPVAPILDFKTSEKSKKIQFKIKYKAKTIATQFLLNLLLLNYKLCFGFTNNQCTIKYATIHINM